jgi:ATP-dependent helicase Lhr and Lhr-like helicase
MPLHPVVLHHVLNSLQWPELRPLQQAAVEPITRGDDALLIAPTAGGKTEAAIFPLLTRMVDERWTGLSTIYVCPLRALLNNLAPRLRAYTSWLGRQTALWHGDITAGQRRKLAGEPPDILLTTPESIEAMLVSTTVSPHVLFANLQAVVVDEVHAFAGDDRGWHLLALLERLTRIADRPLQRIGLSATVGNPEQLLGWLQGSNHERCLASVVAPGTSSDAAADVQLDFVGTVDNAATVVAALHQGEKRLVFAESRRRAEALAVALRGHGVTTFVSHSSLSAEERRAAERAFAEDRNCVIVSTSTLELGVDIGDLDRIIQVGTTRTVASFLQHLGRTGRRAGGLRNTLLLAATDDELMQAAGLLLLWSEGYVEPVIPPPSPRHLQAQQLLALCLQEGQVGENTWPKWFDGLVLATPDESRKIASWLVATGHLDRDNGMLFVGPEAERAFGRRHFLDLVSVFTSAPELTVLAGTSPIGTIDPTVLASKIDGPRVLALAGHSWLVRHVDWRQRKVWVEQSDIRGSSRWTGTPQPWSKALTDAVRRFLQGTDPSNVRLSKRATARLAEVRDEYAAAVNDRGTTITADAQAGARWWTWAGGRANALLAAALNAVSPGLIDEVDRYDNRYLRLSAQHGATALRDALVKVHDRFGNHLIDVPYEISGDALDGLKFAELLPPDLAKQTLAERTLDHEGASDVAQRPRWRG